MSHKIFVVSCVLKPTRYRLFSDQSDPARALPSTSCFRAMPSPLREPRLGDRLGSCQGTRQSLVEMNSMR